MFRRGWMGVQQIYARLRQELRQAISVKRIYQQRRQHISGRNLDTFPLQRVSHATTV